MHSFRMWHSRAKRGFGAALMAAISISAPMTAALAGGFFVDQMQPSEVIPFTPGEGRAADIVPIPSVSDEFTINDMKLGKSYQTITRLMKQKYPNAKDETSETQNYLTDFKLGVRVSTEPYPYRYVITDETGGVYDSNIYIFSPPSSYSRTVGIERTLQYSRESGWGDLAQLKQQIVQKWGNPALVDEDSDSAELYWFRDMNGKPMPDSKECEKLPALALELAHPGGVPDNLLRFDQEAKEVTKTGCWSVLKVEIQINQGHVTQSRFLTFDNYMFGLSISEQQDRVSAELGRYINVMQNKKAPASKL